MDYWKNEDEMQDWVVSHLFTDQYHVQEHKGDPRFPGIPDLSAGGWGKDFWLELKHVKGISGVHEKLVLEHPLDVRQRKWLRDRAKHGSALCGVLVAFRTGDDDPKQRAILGPTQSYLSWVPIDAWETRINGIVMHWAMNRHSCPIPWLMTGKCVLADIIHGSLRPGWGPISDRAAALRDRVQR